MTGWDLEPWRPQKGRAVAHKASCPACGYVLLPVLEPVDGTWWLWLPGSCPMCGLEMIN